MAKPDSALSVLMVLESILPTPTGGGAESQVLTLCRELSDRGAAVVTVVPMVRGGPQVSNDVIGGARVVRLRYPKVRVVGAAWLLCALAWYLLWNRHRYDVIHAHIAGNMAAICSLTGRLLGKPVLVKFTGLTEMRNGVLASRAGLVNRLRKLALKRATFYQATSSRIARMLIDKGFEVRKIRCVPNAVNMERFSGRIQEGPRRAALRAGCRLVGVFVGRLEAEKGLELLLQGWASVFREGADARLLLVGGGSCEAALRSLATELGISDQVHFLGAHQDVETYLACADFGVLTSLHEGLSNTLLEYMAAGLPVLGSRVSGTEDFVTNSSTGWIFPPGDLEGFVDCLEQVAKTSPAEFRRIGHNARELVLERASIRSVVDRLINLYAERGAPSCADSRSQQACVE